MKCLFSVQLNLAHLQWLCHSYSFYHTINLAQTDSRVSKILKSPLWRPLRVSSKIALLIHLPLIYIFIPYFELNEILSKISNFPLLLICFIIILVITYLLSIILCLIYEMPFNGMTSRLTTKNCLLNTRRMTNNLQN